MSEEFSSHIPEIQELMTRVTDLLDEINERRYDSDHKFVIATVPNPDKLEVERFDIKRHSHRDE